MSFAGWAMADLALLFGVGASLITGLYLLRMRRRRVEVPFAALWDRITRDSESRRLWKRLRRLVSWLLQLLVLLLACLALGDPRPEAWLRAPRTLAIVLDASASMGGVGPAPGTTRMELALARARAEVRALGPDDRAVLIVAGAEISVPGPLGSSPTTLLAALDDVTPHPGEAELGRALELAHHVLVEHSIAEILILSDGATSPADQVQIQSCLDASPENWPATQDAEDVENRDDSAARAAPRCRIHLVEGPTANIAITAFAARRYPTDREKVEVLVEVQNLGDTPAKFFVDIEADGISVGPRREVELAAGARERLIEPKLDAARDRLVARLEPFDGSDEARAALGLQADTIAWAVVPPLDPLEVTLITDGTDLFLEAALLILDDHVRLTTLSVAEGTADERRVQDADVVIFDIGDNPLPNPLPTANLVLFDPHRDPTSVSPIPLLRNLDRPRLSEQARKHEILAGVVFKDVNMRRGTSFKVLPTDLPLVSHLGEPIVVLREALRSVLVIGFDPRQSDLPLRTAFPLLIANTVDYFARREAGFVASVAVGTSQELSLANLGLLGRDITAVRIHEPSGSGSGSGTSYATSVQDGRFRIRALVPGVHTIEALDGASTGARVEIAANQASAEASNLRPRIDREALDEAALADTPPPPTPMDEGPLWTLLLLAVATLISLEWASYHRRKTV